MTNVKRVGSVYKEYFATAEEACDFAYICANKDQFEAEAWFDEEYEVWKVVTYRYHKIYKEFGFSNPALNTPQYMRDMFEAGRREAAKAFHRNHEVVRPLMERRFEFKPSEEPLQSGSAEYDIPFREIFERYWGMPGKCRIDKESLIGRRVSPARVEDRIGPLHCFIFDLQAASRRLTTLELPVELKSSAERRELLRQHTTLKDTISECLTTSGAEMNELLRTL